MITWITKNVAIGEYTDALNEELLKKEKIDCILSLRTGLGLESGNDDFKFYLYDRMEIRYYNIPVGINAHIDKESIKVELITAAYMLEQLIGKYKRILVHCTAGIDRAPFVVAYWIAGYSGYGKDINFIYSKEFNFNFWINKAYELIKEKRSQVIEHMEWI